MSFKDIKYSLSDISLEPTATSRITSRSMCNILKDDMLPIFTAPMGCIVDDKNYVTYEDYDIIPIIPTTTHIETRKRLIGLCWVALSLEEFKEIYIRNIKEISKKECICIDCANGHMDELINICKYAKEKYGYRLILMTGNIANPYAYVYYNNACIDFVRIGIGGGAGCTTSVNTGIHYPMASLIYETNEIRKEINGKTKIIADGGISSYGEIIKALALGADYVMLGKMFAECRECGTHKIFKDGIEYNQYYGMSTEKAQEERGFTEFKIEEGLIKEIKVIKSIGQFVHEFAGYLSSAMSYTNSISLDEFIGHVLFNVITENSFNQYSYGKQPNTKY